MQKWRDMGGLGGGYMSMDMKRCAEERKEKIVSMEESSLTEMGV